ncbi:MAG: large-conductance mechanosensitive channel protein MscL [Desulfotomaculaceae bacterium]|nr:large-conductance mechanosensitive channel protein MscL [Desulfotomaculaceae bacterium]
MLPVWQEFKTFAVKGNVMDLAVAVIIGGAFGKIVSSLVGDLIMPLVGLLMGGVNFSGLQIQLGKAVIKYGAFLQNVVDFIIISFALFLVIRAINRLHKKKEDAVVLKEPQASKEELLLTEIRDLLREGCK